MKYKIYKYMTSMWLSTLYLYYYSYPITRRQILDSSKLKESADDHLKFDENGNKLSKRVETLWKKEKLPVTSNFSFSHSVFKRLVSPGRQKVLLCGNGLCRSISCNHSNLSNMSFVNSLPNNKILDWFKLKTFADYK